MDLPRTALNGSALNGSALMGSALTGLLAQLALVDRPAKPASPIKGLGRWLGWKEAIPLAAALQAPPAVTGPPVALAPLVREFQRVQTQLGHTIDDDSSTRGEDGFDFLPFRRHCFGAQQAMGSAITPLRAQLRAAVARLSPAMAQLAALDAVMAGILAPREQALLAQMPVLLDKHFTRLREQHGGGAGHPWLDTFRHDMRRLLHAELELRLQPAHGLLQTLRQTSPESP